jgi:TonB-dependent SusC/RagA subfamily outer membrane receptor
LLNPNDIDSISILKGGQAGTLYGSAGVNGALVITTKRGSQGKARVTYSNATNIEQISFLPQFQDKYGNGSHYASGPGTTGYKTDYKERMKDNWRPFENQQYGDPYDGSQRILGRELEDGSQFVVPYSAIDGERRRIWNTGFTTNNQVAVEGGQNNNTYRLSVENNSTKGVVPDEFGKTVSNAMMTGMNNNIGAEGVVSDQSRPMNVTNNNIDEFPHTNTRFYESELKYNPFYAKKSTSIVENKRMYNLDTNYLMSEIKKKQTDDPDFIVTSEIISNILAGKQKASVPIPLDYTKQQELHIDFCDF